MPKLKPRTGELKTGHRSIPQEAERWGVSQDWIRQRIASGELKIYRAGRVIRIDPRDTDRLFTTYGGES